MAARTLWYDVIRYNAGIKCKNIQADLTFLPQCQQNLNAVIFMNRCLPHADETELHYNVQVLLFLCLHGAPASIFSAYRCNHKVLHLCRKYSKLLKKITEYGARKQSIVLWAPLCHLHGTRYNTPCVRNTDTNIMRSWPIYCRPTHELYIHFPKQTRVYWNLAKINKKIPSEGINIFSQLKISPRAWRSPALTKALL